jgi:uncharacterized membrane protein
MMKRDTKIVLWVVTAIPAVILGTSALCAWAVAHGASPRWRLLFRFMCHGIPERCLLLFGVPMPICARCVGVYVGLLAGLWITAAAIARRYAVFPRERILRIVALAAITPLGIDGLTQLVGLRESTNPLRIATGLIAGFAFGMWILSAVEHREERLLTTP